MVDRQGKVDFCPFVEYIDKKDIRNAFALPRFDALSGRKTHSKVFDPDFSVWNFFHSEPMTDQVYTSEDFESDISSASSGGSSGQPLRSNFITREPQVHLIPVLVERRDDSSGYKSDTRSNEVKEPVNVRKPSTLKQGKLTVQANPKKSPVSPKVQYKGTPSVENKSSQSDQMKTTNNLIKPAVKIDGIVKIQPMDEIREVLDELESIRNQVEKFSASTENRQYKHLKEKLNCLLVKLDDVNTDGNDEIRQSRKSAAKKIRACISLLETKS